MKKKYIYFIIFSLFALCMVAVVSLFIYDSQMKAPHIEVIKTLHGKTESI